MRRLMILSMLVLSPLIGQVEARQADPMEAGILAFRAGRYADAVNAFERAVEANPQNAEAYFLMARIYFETPLRDTGKAGQFIEKALEIEPDNVKYLVAQLEQLRVDSWNFIIDKIREQKRRDLANRILRLDSTNAFAHEELGRAYISDFWRYRNAFMVPTFAFRQFNGENPFAEDPLQGFQSENIQFDPTTGGSQLEVVEASREPTGSLTNPNGIFLNDQFNIEALRMQGVPIQDLSERAQRAYDRAIGHLYKALESDPRKREVYDDLMRIFALKGEFGDALEMLGKMYAYYPEDPSLWTFLGLAHYRTGNMEAAAKAFQTAFEYMDPEMAEAYSRLDPILPEEEKKKYLADPTGYASRFWTSKDPRYLTPFNERKLEHYARLTYADLLYGSPKVGLRGWDTERGRILVRYGIPEVDVFIMPRQMYGGAQQGLNPIAGTAPSPNADIEADPSNLQATRPSQRLLSTFDITTEVYTINIWDYGEFKFVFEDPFKNGEFRLFSPSAKSIAAGTDPWANDYVMIAKQTFRRIPDRFEYKPPGRQVELPYLVSSFKGPDGQAEVFVNFGIPITRFDPKEDMINLTARTGTFLISSERDMLAERRRTIYGLRTEQIVQFPDVNLWVDGQRLVAPPGEHELSVEFETASGGTVAVQRRKVEVPDFATDKLLLSDIMLAYHVEDTPDGKPLSGADVVRNGLSIRPAPWSVFDHRQPIYLYFEIYNLTLNEAGQTDYEIEAFLRPKDMSSGLSKLVKGIFGGDEKGVSVRLPGQGTQVDDNHYLILDASNQPPDRLYTLRLVVKDRVSGKETERILDLFLD